MSRGASARSASGLRISAEELLISACEFQGEPVVLEPYQRAIMEEQRRFSSALKARRVGFSFTVAARAFARSQLRDNHDSIIISYSKSDAQERIHIARQLYDGLPRSMRTKRLHTDSKSELWFVSPSGAMSRIIAFPCKAARGREGDLYLDEMAHYPDDVSVYAGSLAALTRCPDAQVMVGSTPLGARGRFWEIASKPDRYPSYVRREIPWWLSSALCKNVTRALKEGVAYMLTAERVERYGTEVLRELFLSMDLEYFQQEYECAFVDDSLSYYGYDLIIPCLEDVDLPSKLEDVRVGDGRLVAGYDVGRTGDVSALWMFEQGEKYEPRFYRVLADETFATQEAFLREVLGTFRIGRLSIDATGIGMHLAENLERDFPQVVSEAFTAPAKERWCTGFKILLQNKQVVIPKEPRDVIHQIHSIRRLITASGNVVFKAPRRGKNHADHFWAIALACQREQGAEVEDEGPALVVGRVRLTPKTRQRRQKSLRRRLGLD